MTLETKSETMAKRECTSSQCDEVFEAAPPCEGARYCSQDCSLSEKQKGRVTQRLSTTQSTSQEPEKEYVRQWVLRVKLGDREIRIKSPFCEKL